MANSYQKRTAKANFSAWENSYIYSIDEAYNSYSTAKAQAWDYCRDLCTRYNGRGLKIINFNTFIFTAGFEFIDYETGVVKFMYITPNYDVAIDAPCEA